jgi:threonine dehydrogenase-like Zn-dependent dehydrogenase
MHITFNAPEYRSDGTFASAAFEFDGSEETGWRIWRNGTEYLNLGPGYAAVDVDQCGVCSTDLARAFLPFPLPQVTGHEILGRDAQGRRVVLEINASHQARNVDSECVFCRQGLERHCPERLVLGIHDLPGGFGPHVLAPVNSIIPLPDEIPSSAAVLIEPLAAALNAVEMVKPKAGERIAVLGPRRLGMLVVAALAAYRKAHGIPFQILGFARHAHLLELSREFGADEGIEVVGEGESMTDTLADVVIDTTGNPKGLELAIRIAGREVHLKSTHGQPAVGLSHLTELVVDELSIAPYAAESLSGRRGAWLAAVNPPAGAGDSILRGDPMSVFDRLQVHAGNQLPRADVAVVDSAELVDAVIRPSSEHQQSLVRPRGEIQIMAGSSSMHPSPLLQAVADRGLRLSSSRCGDFHAAIDLLRRNENLRQVGDRLVTHHFSNASMNEVFRVARASECLKAVVTQ